MSNILEALNAIVKEKKKFERITQKLIAERMGTSQPAVTQYLKGDTGITIELLEKFCAALEIKLSDLENWSPELAEIRLSHGSGKVAPPELVKARAKLDKLYEVNKPAFDGVIGTIDVWLKQSKAGNAPEAEASKKADTA